MKTFVEDFTLRQLENGESLDAHTLAKQLACSVRTAKRLLRTIYVMELSYVHEWRKVKRELVPVYRYKKPGTYRTNAKRPILEKRGKKS